MGNFEFDYYIKEEKEEYTSSNKQINNVINYYHNVLKNDMIIKNSFLLIYK